MIQGYSKIDPKKLSENVFSLVGSDWMLITAGTPESYNTMTASWGGFGVLWSRNIAWCVVRPQRYTRQFLEREQHFTLSFFAEKYRDALQLCGSTSGRDSDKAGLTGLRPIAGGLPATTTFAQARLVIECRKIYFQDLNPDNFIDPSIAENYPTSDYHRMYIGEIVNCWIK